MKVLITVQEGLNIYGELIESLETRYVRFFGGLGWDLIPILSSTDFSYALDDIDAIILTGGGTVPNTYRVSPTDEFQQTERDRTEEALLEFALKKQIPIIGICRGMQFINGYFGGKVDRIGQFHPANVRHNVVLPGNEIIEVNSYHQDAVTVELLAPGFVILAMDPSIKIVEAMYSIEHKVVAFQWHPEREEDSSACKEFSVRSIQNLIKKEVVYY